MARTLAYIVVALLLSHLIMVGPTRAELVINGELSVDLDSYVYDQKFKDTVLMPSYYFDSLADSMTVEYDTIPPSSSYSNRNISNHLLSLSLISPIVNEQFASFSGRAAIYGTYYDARSNENGLGLEKASEYFYPTLNSYRGNLSLFPNRPYPLLLYLSKNLNRAVRYEPNNRSDTLLVSPGLQVIRRYDGVNRTRGGQWKYTPRKNINFIAEYKQDKSNITRFYDFDENQNIWIDIRAYGLDTTVNDHRVTVLNELPDSVDLFIDGIQIATVGPTGTPGNTVFLIVEVGDHYVEFIPHNTQQYNPFRNRIVVNSEQDWRIHYNPPATPNDLRQTLTSFSAKLKTEPTEKIGNETHYEYSAMNETVQNMTSFIGNFNNTFRYDINRLNNVQMLTTYSKNQTQIDTLTPQTSAALLHQTTLSMATRKNLSSSVSHSLNLLKSFLPSGTGLKSVPHDTLKSTTNIIMGRMTYRVNRFNYQADFKNSATILSDSLHYGLRPVDTNVFDYDVTDSIPPDTTLEPRMTNGYRSNQYISDLTSKFQWRLWRFNLQPRHQIKYSYGKQKNPDQNSTEWENRFSLDGELLKIGFLDKIKFKGEYGRRSRTTNSGTENQSKSDIKNRYIIDLSLTQNFTKKYRLMVLTTFERETFGGSASTAGVSAETINTARQPQDKFSFKINFQASPFPDVLINAGISQISQITKQPIEDNQLLKYTPNTIKRYTLSLITTIPKLDIPIKSFLMSESRQLNTIDADKFGKSFVFSEPAQVQTTLETKMIYRFRKIALTVSHYFKYENLKDEKYDYQEIRGKVSRQFSF